MKLNTYNLYEVDCNQWKYIFKYESQVYAGYKVWGMENKSNHKLWETDSQVVDCVVSEMEIDCLELMWAFCW